MTRHERTLMALSGLAVAALLGWAALRPSLKGGDTAFAGDRTRPAMALLERSEGIPEMRRLIQRMLAR